MKKTFKYSLLTLASTLIMAACSKDDIEQPTPEDTNINLKTLADFKANMNTVNDDKKTYKAFVTQDIAADSIGLATTLTDWKKMNDSKNNLTTNWGSKGIYVEKIKWFMRWLIILQRANQRLSLIQIMV